MGRPQQIKTRAEDAVVPFGTRHKGKTLGEIVNVDPGYIHWLHNWDRLRGPLLVAVATVYAKYQDEIDAAVEFKKHC